MSRLEPEARINSRLLEKYKGQTVRLTVKVLSISGDQATVESSDRGQVGVHIGRDSHIAANTFIEIIGNVRDDLTVKALSIIHLGNSLDMKAVQAVVDFSQSHKGQGVLA